MEKIEISPYEYITIENPRLPANARLNPPENLFRNYSCELRFNWKEK
jgi:hypothetical protein